MVLPVGFAMRESGNWHLEMVFQIKKRASGGLGSGC